MHWLLALPLLPLLVCGAMCLGSALLVVLGLRRREDASPPPPAEARVDDSVDTHTAK